MEPLCLEALPTSCLASGEALEPKGLSLSRRIHFDSPRGSLIGKRISPSQPLPQRSLLRGCSGFGTASSAAAFYQETECRVWVDLKSELYYCPRTL